jgi:3-deoxy-D-arabino-heptulosonate 7-phosphate (DAHP) synthase class II
MKRTTLSKSLQERLVHMQEVRLDKQIAALRLRMRILMAQRVAVSESLPIIRVGRRPDDSDSVVSMTTHAKDPHRFDMVQKREIKVAEYVPTPEQQKMGEDNVAKLMYNQLRAMVQSEGRW